jgi:hypothetical protein
MMQYYYNWPTTETWAYRCSCHLQVKSHACTPCSAASHPMAFATFTSLQYMGQRCSKYGNMTGARKTGTATRVSTVHNKNNHYKLFLKINISYVKKCKANSEVSWPQKSMLNYQWFLLFIHLLPIINLNIWYSGLLQFELCYLRADMIT